MKRVTKMLRFVKWEDRIMNNRFGDSRQRFSIRKFTVGVARSYFRLQFLV
ncbi:MAG: YSIRK-type signal peptide-containing protein [Streptococcus sp.]